MKKWIQDAFFSSIKQKELNDPYTKTSNIKDMLAYLINGNISEFYVIIYGNIITISLNKCKITADIIYVNESSLEFIKTVVLPDIIKEIEWFNITIKSTNIKLTYIPNIIKQFIIPRQDLNISNTSNYYILSKDKLRSMNMHYMNQINQTYAISMKFDLITCTFSSSLKLYKLANPNREYVKKLINKHIGPLINLLELLTNKQERVELALETIANLNFLTHSKITTNLLTPLAINQFVKFCRNIPTNKIFEETWKITNDDKFFKHFLDFPITFGYSKIIYSDYGITIKSLFDIMELRIFTQKLPSNINSLRAVITLITMFGDYDKFKVEAEKFILKNI